MAKSAKTPYSAVIGTGIPNQVAPGAGLKISHTKAPQPTGTKDSTKIARTNRLSPRGAGNW